MLTEYVADVSHWEKWQQEYRFGVLLLFPPDPFLTQVNALRDRYDPQSQATCAAHISLTIPLPRPISEAQWRELESIASAIEPFRLQVGPLMNYLPHPGVCLAIAPQDVLDGLRATLESASVFAGASVRSYPFSAHMTIAEFITIEQTAALMDELKSIAPIGAFVCTDIAYAVPDADFHFSARRRLGLVRQAT